MNQSRLSLIVPAFNEEKTIPTILDRIFSVLPDVHEVLVIDDGSTDHTFEAAHECSLQEPRVRLFDTNETRAKLQCSALVSPLVAARSSSSKTQTWSMTLCKEVSVATIYVRVRRSVVLDYVRL
jgi:cellulose synthase/poly-beta-1,6-N-acetylglucosamine synthase-like glycosyltransferase